MGYLWRCSRRFKENPHSIDSFVWHNVSNEKNQPSLQLLWGSLMGSHTYIVDKLFNEFNMLRLWFESVGDAAKFK